MPSISDKTRTDKLSVSFHVSEMFNAIVFVFVNIIRSSNVLFFNPLRLDGGGDMRNNDEDLYKTLCTANFAKGDAV